MCVDNALSFQKKRNETTEWNVCLPRGQGFFACLAAAFVAHGLAWMALAALQRVRGYFTDFNARGNLGTTRLAVWSVFSRALCGLEPRPAGRCDTAWRLSGSVRKSFRARVVSKAVPV
jgi:hypothetical protein